MTNSLKPVTCPKCGWNHFGVDREYAEHQAQEFQEYYDALPEEKRITYYGKILFVMNPYLL